MPRRSEPVHVGGETGRSGVQGGLHLTSDQFQRFSTFIFQTVGIKMPPAKKIMLEARLQKRLKSLGIPDFDTYAEYLFSPEGRGCELIHLIDAVTTNKTDFFREPAHFDILTRTVLPDVASRKRGGEPVRIWSAGCSTGEEPYTIAMVAAEYAARQSGFSFTILASDISTRVLETARTAIYPADHAEPIPHELKRKYLLRSKDPARGEVRIVPGLRSLVRFRRINFMDDDFGIRERLDVIFCRNVVIYFDKPTQRRLMEKFHRHLVRGGYLFIGHSETLNGFNLDFEPVGSTVYRKP